MKTTQIFTTLLFVTALPQLSLAKSKAPVAPVQKEILFNDGEISDLRENSRFEITENVISTFKVPRDCSGSQAFKSDDKVMMVNVSIIKDTKTGKVYHENTTFRHIDDGDNTSGWIEEVNDAADHDGGIENEGRVVAVIGDSFMGACK